jgi:hypothetical protein
MMIIRITIMKKIIFLVYKKNTNNKQQMENVERR